MVSLFAGILSASYVWWYAYSAQQFEAGGSDFDLFWGSAKALITTGDASTFKGPVPFLYPLPAVIVSTPFALLPRVVARLAFALLSSGLLAFALSREGFHRLPLLMSAALIDAARTGQSSTLFAASVLMPSLGWLIAVKPNLGAAVCAATASRRTLVVAVAGSGLLAAVSFVIDPHWIRHWLEVLPKEGLYRIPFISTGGTLLALALLKWRRPEARLLFAWACVPHAPLLYDVLPLGLLARDFRESLAFALLTYIALFLQHSYIEISTTGSATLAATILNLVVYLPCLLAVLARPNEGAPPAWLSMCRVGKESSPP